MDSLTRHADASRPGPGTRSVKRSVLGAGVPAALPAPSMAEGRFMRPEAGRTCIAATVRASHLRRKHRGV